MNGKDKKYKKVKYIFMLFFATFALFNALKYIEYVSIRKNHSPIEYVLLDNIYHAGGRGEYYEIKVKYKQQEYFVDITSEISSEIKFNKMPVLYFSETTNSVFSLWGIKRSLRLFLLFSTLLALAFIFPYVDVFLQNRVNSKK